MPAQCVAAARQHRDRGFLRAHRAMMRWAIALGAAMMVTAAPDAQACRIPISTSSPFNEHIPRDAGEEPLILRVEILPHEDDWEIELVHARVIGVILGTFEGDVVRVPVSSAACMVAPPAGTRGYVIGAIDAGRSGIPVLEPGRYQLNRR